jgi:hypothetical protein
MLSNKIIAVLTSQDQSAFIWRHTAHKHAAGNVVGTRVNFPKTKAYTEGFPHTAYHVSVTPSQPCAVHVTEQDQSGFRVVMTSLNDIPLAEGTFSVVCIG